MNTVAVLVLGPLLPQPKRFPCCPPILAREVLTPREWRRVRP